MHVKERDNQLILQTRLRSMFAMLIFGLIFALSGLAVGLAAGLTLNMYRWYTRLNDSSRRPLSRF